MGSWTDIVNGISCAGSTVYAPRDSDQMQTDLKDSESHVHDVDSHGSPGINYQDSAAIQYYDKHT